MTSKLSKYKDYLVTWIRQEVVKANMKGVIIGMSGGVDSSVVAALAKAAFPNHALGVYLPIVSMGQDLVDAQLVAQKINIATTTIDLTSTFDTLLAALPVQSQLAQANIKPRLRMTALYALAQQKQYLVLGTDNAAEWLLGYFTKYGDGGADLLPLVHLTKHNVNQLAKILGLPPIIYTKPPSAGLWPGQTDEAELGFSYHQVDRYLEGKKIDSQIAQKIKTRSLQTMHKRVGILQPKKY